ncbi:hypothetical protein HDU91_003298, partial [Kappamyces sp. JEL0680]
MILMEGVDVVAVVAGDAVKQLSSQEFLARADQTCFHPSSDLSSPIIPSGYDRIAQWHMAKYGVDRDDLAACSALASLMAMRHPYALTREPRTIKQVLEAPPVGKVTTVLECARRADAGACVLVASSDFVERAGIHRDVCVDVISGGEASGPLYPPPIDQISPDHFSCEEAAAIAYGEAHLSVRDIDFFGLYDCFPICLIRAIEAVGLAGKGNGAKYVKSKYEQILLASKENDYRPQDIFPINTHGGLLAFGAPWEVPAMYNVIEAYQQLTDNAEDRQIEDCRRALVYGNGGIFSHSAVAILGNGR